MAQVSDYLSLIPAANAGKPNFVALVSLLTQGAVDANNMLQSMVPDNFNVNTAVGAQLDIIGKWVGIGRFVTILLSNWFSFDTAGLGWDQGVWWVPYESETGIMALDDDTYRSMILAKIAWNNWDGTTPTYYAMLSQLFAPCTVTIADNLNHSIAITVTGSMPNATLQALATEDLLPFAPCGINVSYTFVS